MFEAIVTKEESGSTLQQFLRSHALGTAKTIKAMLQCNRCMINGHIERFASAVLLYGDHITISKNNPTKPISILYQSSDTLVIDKPSGIPSDLRQLKLDAMLVHRLDKETSGVMLLAKHQKAAHYYEMLFKKRLIKKQYLAIAEGEADFTEKTLDIPLASIKTYQGQSIYGYNKRGKSAVTYIKALHTYRGRTLFLLEPKTGRTHQLRAHLKTLAHPIVGDFQYGAKNSDATRVLLHAFSLSFMPINSLKPLNLYSELPKEFYDIWPNKELESITCI